jgi:adenylate cyclase
MSAGVERKLAAILSADAVGYSRLMAEDEEATARRLSPYRDEIGLLVRQHRGRVVDSPGDNLLAEFPTATDALECAVEIQRVIAARNASLAPERRMDLRIGVHLGEITVGPDRIYGNGVNVAARLQALAEPGGICVSAAVLEQVGKKVAVAYRDIGPRSTTPTAPPRVSRPCSAA